MPTFFGKRLNRTLRPVCRQAMSCCQRVIVLLRTLCAFSCLAVISLAQAGTVTFNSSGSWTAPAGVTSVTVEVWGGGGAGGGQNPNRDGGGGGGGGGYSRSIIAVTPGNTYAVSVGGGGASVTNGTGGTGGDSFFINATTVMAKGGVGGAPSTGTPPPGGLGGAAAAGVGTIKFSGGNGGRALDNNTGQGGPGGSSAGTAANGTSGPNSWSTVTAAAPPTGGGIGGNGGGTGINGFAPASGRGGGGGGSGEGPNRTGGAGAAGSVVLNFIGLPTVSTAAASGIAATGATINGSVTSDSNASTTVTFEYGLTGAYGSSAAATPSPVAANATNAVSAALTGLACNTTYHFRAKGVNTSGTVNGGNLTFTTTACVPSVVTVAASAVTGTTATINGTVSSNGASTAVTFDYGLTVAYGSTATASASPLAANAVSTAVSAAVTGLTCGATYHFRVNGTNSAGTTNGGNATFTTPACAPTAVTGAASSVTDTTATLNGTVTGNGATTAVTFDYGLTVAYGTNVVATPGSVAAGASSAVSVALTGLTASTLYHFRVKGVNSAGTSNGLDGTFTTSAPPVPTLTKTVSSASAVVNDVVTFTIVLNNPTAAALTSVVVNDTLPTGMGYAAHSATLGTLAGQPGQALTWSIPSVPAGGSATLTLAVTLTQAGVLANTVTSTGIVSSSASVLVVAGAVTHFRMDETAGSWAGTTGEVIDSGSTGLHGTRFTTTAPTTTNAVAPSPTIASQYPSVIGGFCNAGQFDGRAVVQVADSPLFDYTQTLSASAWIYPTAYPTGDLYSILSNDVNYEFHLDTAGRLYWWWGGPTLTSAATVPLNQWTHIAITFNSATGRQRIYINGVQDTNTNNWTGTLTANACNFYVGGDVATGSCALIPGRNFRGMIDEVKLYNTELSVSEVQANMTLGRSCTGSYDHIRIEHDGSGSVCTAETITVKACLNASCSTLYPGAVTVGLSPTGWVGGDTFSFSGGVGSRQLSRGSSGNVTLGTTSSSPLAASATRCFNGATETCTFNFANASCSFDAVEPSAAPQTRLYTKLAGTAFNVDVLALSSASVINTGYTGTVNADLVDATASSCPTGAGLTAAQSLTFLAANAGRKPATFTYAGAAQNVRVRMVVGAGTPACSTDNFAVRPSAVSFVTSATAAAPSSTAAPVIKAGANFSLQGTTSVGSGYAGTLALDATKLTAQTTAQDSTQASGGVVGTLSPATLVGNAAAVNATYSEVGYLYLAPGAYRDDTFTAVDSVVGDCVTNTAGNANLSDVVASGKYGCSIGNKGAVSLGRFIPHHFDTVVTQGCVAGAFTYSAQPFSVGVTARNLAGSATQNYAGNFFAKATALSNAGDATNMTGNTLLAAGFANGAGTANAVTYTFPPPATTAPLALTLRALDTDAVTSATFTEGTTNIRSGRLQLQNAYGSELLGLPIPLAIQFWNNGWRQNTLDFCTTIAADQFAWTFPAGTVARPNGLLQCESIATVTGTAPNYTVRLSAPGAANAGWAVLTLNLDTAAAGNTCTTTVNAGTGFTGPATTANTPWLRHNWSGAVGNPVSRATFGAFRSPLIYRRENY